MSRRRKLDEYDQTMLAMLEDPGRDPLDKVMSCIFITAANMPLADDFVVSLIGSTLDHWSPRPEAA
ncbi:hypothetical protein [Sinomonas sp. P10A9]|uniref:Mutator family transposase n=1 Tax=Sinomonas puerhi TaxID=3238584 RepID=A0AB39L0B1_9MICC